jgi:hypothetical protein
MNIIVIFSSIALVLISTLVGQISAEKCLHPPPAEGYTNEKYSGRWYEIGKVRKVLKTNKKRCNF